MSSPSPSPRRVSIALIGLALTVAGCVTRHDTTTRTASPPPPATAPSAAASVAAAEPLASIDAEPNASDRVLRSDLFEVGPAPVLTVRVRGALFATSTRAALAEQRPSAVVRVVRSREIPAGIDIMEDGAAYSVEIEQRPGGKLTLAERHAYELLNALQEPTDAGAGSKLVGTEVRFADARLLRSVTAPDVVTVESANAVVTYDRTGLADVLVRAAQTIQTLRGPGR